MSHHVMPKDHQLTVARARSFHAAAATCTEAAVRTWIAEHHPDLATTLYPGSCTVYITEAGIASTLIGELLAIIDHLTT